MATQLKPTDFAPFIPQPRPNIRIAYSAGPATNAVHAAIEQLPRETREASLDELALTSRTERLIATAKDVLSPGMYTAFLRWGEGAAHSCTWWSCDEEGDARCAATYEAIKTVATVPAANPHDLLFKVYLDHIENADCCSFGPSKMRAESPDDVDLPVFTLANDVRYFSPIPSLIDELSTQAWSLSPVSAFTEEVGSAIVRCFSAARGADSVGREAAAPLAWQRAYGAFRAIEEEMEDYDRNVVAPAAARFDAVRSTYPVDYDFAADAAAQAALDAVDYPEIEAYSDLLCDQRYDAMMRVYLVPAPGPAELAVKLEVFEENDSKGLVRAGEIIHQFAIDARRLGAPGPSLPTDRAILDAFATMASAMRQLADLPVTAPVAEADEIYRWSDASLMKLSTEPATTVEGVVAKLRVAFAEILEDDWSDDAVLAPNSEEFTNALAMDDFFPQMLWAAIKDLARIGGVKLEEQGA